MVSVGLAMIAQNEQIHMPATLAQFYHCVEDIVVVDGGSTDKTAWWAEKMGARVISRPFQNDFADQKNFAIAQLDTDWVYLHDPDERLEPQTLELVPSLISKEGQRLLRVAGVLPNAEGDFDCFGFARKNFIDGVQTDVYPDYQYRLFTRNCRFEGRVDEKIIGFTCRTELSYQHPSVNLRVLSSHPCFNILHYKSSSKQKTQDEL
jgi:glycosyltransferase involved in cell wall biosynthesis